MTEVIWWEDPDQRRMLYQAYVPESGLQVDEQGRPLTDQYSQPLGIHNVNATGRSFEEMQAYIVESWNRQHPDGQRTVDDFEFVQTSRADIDAAAAR